MGPAGSEFGVAEGRRAIANPGPGWGVHFRRTQETAIGTYKKKGKIFKSDRDYLKMQEDATGASRIII